MTRARIQQIARTTKRAALPTISLAFIIAGAYFAGVWAWGMIGIGIAMWIDLSIDAARRRG